MNVPERYARFACGDYFGSKYAKEGYWDDANQIELIVRSDATDDASVQDFLSIGRPGVDGILFGYRAGESGLWAYYPIEQEFTFLAPTIETLLEGWFNGWITV